MGEKPKISRSVIMFLITLVSVFLVYGFQWTAGNPLTDSDIAWESAQFALGLMGILLCHELGHYFVAKRHGFSLSVPYFLPFPFAFGTLGAVIHLQSLPKSRTALLEMGAAGPIAGFIATIFCFFIDAHQTQNYIQPHLVGSLEEAQLALIELSSIELSSWEMGLQKIGLIPETSTEAMPLMILSDPLLLKEIVGMILGEALSPYAELGPFAFAGWVGCMITSINLLPIGQLDGGHIANALFPRKAATISKVVLLMAVIMSYLWLGWLVWAVLLYFMGATISVEVPKDSELKSRSKWIAGMAVVVFGLCVMTRPIYIDMVELTDIVWEEDLEHNDAEESR